MATRHTTRAARRSTFAPVVVSAAVAVIRLVALGPHLVDDAYISFRYAVNLASGDGLVFNHGQRVEGYSNFLWTLFLAGASRIGLDLPHTAIVLGGAAFVAAVMLTVVTAQRVGLGPTSAGLIGCAVAVLPVTAGSSLLGLEEPLFMLGISLGLYAIVGTSRPAALASGMAIVIIGLTRPEGVFLALTVAVAFVATRSPTDPDERRPALYVVGVAIAVLAMWKLWAHAYYGEWLPMSVIAKRDHDVGIVSSVRRSYRDGMQYIRLVLGRGWTLLVLSAVVVGAFVWRALHRLERRLVAVAGSLCAFGAAVTISNKGDWMPFGRLIAPYVPSLLLAVAVVLDAATRRLSSWTLRRPAVAVLVVVLLIMQPLDWHAAAPAVAGSGDDFGRDIARAHLPDDQIASGLLGRIGFFAPSVPIEDLYGLTEPAVAKAPLPASVFGKLDPIYSASLHPTLIVDNAWGDVFRVVDANSDDYVALVGDDLDAAHLFTVVRTGAAARYLDALRRDFPNTIVAPIEEARQRWPLAYPAGASQAPA